MPDSMPESKEITSTESWREHRLRQEHRASSSILQVAGGSCFSSVLEWAAQEGRPCLSSSFLCLFICMGLCHRKLALQGRENHFLRGSAGWRNR